MCNLRFGAAEPVVARAVCQLSKLPIELATRTVVGMVLPNELLGIQCRSAAQHCWEPLAGLLWQELRAV